MRSWIVNCINALVLIAVFGMNDPKSLTLQDLRIEVRPLEGGVHVRMAALNGPTYAEGPARYQMEIEGEARREMAARIVSGDANTLTIRAEAAGIELLHEISIHKAFGGLSESIRLRNTTSQPIAITDYRFGLRRRHDAAGSLRAVAVPFRRQADGKLRDWTLAEIEAGKAANSDWRNDTAAWTSEPVDSRSGRLRSEGWILSDGQRGLLVAKYNQDDIEYSMLDWEAGGFRGLSFGGSTFALYREPESMQSLRPGQWVSLGTTYYLPFEGDWPAGYRRFRSLLNDLGHGLTADYNPRVNWNELFDVGWYHSDPSKLARYYTRESLLREASKAAEIGATMLYLDPGWEVCEGTSLWDTDRLGTVASLVRELRDRYNLELGFRTIGRVYRDEFPRGWYMRRPPGTQPYDLPVLHPAQRHPVPEVNEGKCRNLALLPDARATASSLLPNSKLHNIANLNDGWYGNAASWISNGEPSWAQIDLGADYPIASVRLGSEHTPVPHDRAIRHLRLLVAPTPEAGEPRWDVVAEYSGELIREIRTFQFAERPARLIRVEILEADIRTARLDEIEVYEAEPRPWTVTPRRRELGPPEPPKPLGFWEICTLHPDWQKEKLKRLTHIVSQGMTFAMFDEFDWRGPCHCPDHGHPTPSTPEAHVRAVYGLIREVKKQAPNLLVEAHDPVWPWGSRYLPIYFDQTLDPGRRPGSYEENWGFEFMWNPIRDLISGRAACLYYYNLGCDIPLYDHITMEGDNDSCLAFWWYASTVRHLGIGGKKGLNSQQENPVRWEAWKKAMRQYLRLRDWFVKGEFVGMDELTHLHILPGRPGGVLVGFNLDTQAVNRSVSIDLRRIGMTGHTPRVTGATAREEAGRLELSLQIEPRSPVVVEISN